MTNENGHDSHADAATGQDQHLGTLTSFVEVPVHRKQEYCSRNILKGMFDVIISIIHKRRRNILFSCSFDFFSNVKYINFGEIDLI